jgi:hypothetical protein
VLDTLCSQPVLDGFFNPQPGQFFMLSHHGTLSFECNQGATCGGAALPATPPWPTSLSSLPYAM